MFGLPLGPQGSVAPLGCPGDDEDWDRQEELLKIAKQYCSGWASWDAGFPPEQSRDAVPTSQTSGSAFNAAGSQLGKTQGSVGASLRRRSPSPDPAEEEEFIVDAVNELRAQASGVTYRWSKDLDDKDDDSEIAAWGSVLRGADRGDGWLRVGGRYLPMVVGGGLVLHRTVAGADGSDWEDEEGGRPSDGEGWEEDPMDRLFRHAEQRVAAAEREKQELKRRTRQALQSSATWQRRREDPTGAPPSAPEAATDLRDSAI